MLFTMLLHLGVFYVTLSSFPFWRHDLFKFLDEKNGNGYLKLHFLEKIYWVYMFFNDVRPHHTICDFKFSINQCISAHIPIPIESCDLSGYGVYILKTKSVSSEICLAICLLLMQIDCRHPSRYEIYIHQTKFD